MKKIILIILVIFFIFGLFTLLTKDEKEIILEETTKEVISEDQNQVVEEDIKEEINYVEEIKITPTDKYKIEESYMINHIKSKYYNGIIPNNLKYNQLPLNDKLNTLIWYDDKNNIVEGNLETTVGTTFDNLNEYVSLVNSAYLKSIKQVEFNKTNEEAISFFNNEINKVAIDFNGNFNINIDTYNLNYLDNQFEYLKIGEIFFKKENNEIKQIMYENEEIIYGDNIYNYLIFSENNMQYYIEQLEDSNIKISDELEIFKGELTLMNEKTIADSKSIDIYDVTKYINVLNSVNNFDFEGEDEITSLVVKGLSRMINVIQKQISGTFEYYKMINEKKITKVTIKKIIDLLEIDIIEYNSIKELETKDYNEIHYTDKIIDIKDITNVNYTFVGDYDKIKDYIYSDKIYL